METEGRSVIPGEGKHPFIVESGLPVVPRERKLQVSLIKSKLLTKIVHVLL